MKPNKISLSELQIKSFVTYHTANKFNTIKAGGPETTLVVVVGTAAAGAVSYYLCEKAYNAVVDVAKKIGEANDNK